MEAISEQTSQFEPAADPHLPPEALPHHPPRDASIQGEIAQQQLAVLSELDGHGHPNFPPAERPEIQVEVLPAALFPDFDAGARADDAVLSGDLDNHPGGAALRKGQSSGTGSGPGGGRSR